MARVVDDNKASIVTNSWGLPSEYVGTGLIVAYEQVFEQGAAQGIGFLFSSGDNGDDVKSTGILQTDYPTSDPWVTSVGGTSTGIDYQRGPEPGGRLGNHAVRPVERREVVGARIRINPFRYGAGGGFSTLFNRPDYQDGVVPSGLPAGRAVPDVCAGRRPEHRHAHR